MLIVYYLLWTGAGNRYKMQQLQQKDWCEQQIAEKQRKKDVDKNISEMFDDQTIHQSNILKETQEVYNKNRTQNEVDTDAVNLILAQEKKEREIR